MSRSIVTGTRSVILWLLGSIAVILLVGVAITGSFVLPYIERRLELNRHYRAGVAFQSAEEWEAAREEYMQAIALDAGYQDAQMRLVEVKAKLTEAVTTATAVASVHAQATATAYARATATANANAQATVAAAATATAEAVEAHYQKGLGRIELGQWEQAKAELQQVFETDPNYKDVQAKLAEVEKKLQETPTPTSTPTSTPTPVVYSLSFRGDDGLLVREEYALQANGADPVNLDDQANAQWDMYHLPIEARLGQENVITVSVVSGDNSALTFDFVRLDLGDTTVWAYGQGDSSAQELCDRGEYPTGERVVSNTSERTVDVYIDDTVVVQNALIFPSTIFGGGHSGPMTVRIHFYVEQSP